MIEILLVILAIICPPLPVAIRKGLDVELLICIILTVLGWLPGLIYAIYVILSDD